MLQNRVYCENCIDSKNSIFTILNDEQRQILYDYHTCTSYKKGEIIYKEGDKPSGLICLSKGKVKVIKEGVGGEIQLTDAMQELAQKDELYSWTFPGKRYDIGTMKDWFQAHIELSSKSEFSELLDEVIDNL